MIRKKIGTKYCASMMYANGHAPKPGEGVISVMTHMIREIKGGVELRSRFWIGYQIEDGKPVKLLPDGVSIPAGISKALFHHNIKEFTHLASILPPLYAENAQVDSDKK